MSRLRTGALFGILVHTLAAQTSPPRIAIGGIVHETNTFNPKKTTVADFETGIGGANGILRGDAIVTELASSNNTIAGFIEGAKQRRLELYPTLMAGPQTIGTVTDEAFLALTGELVDRLKRAPRSTAFCCSCTERWSPKAILTPTPKWCAACARRWETRSRLLLSTIFMPTSRRRSCG